LNNPPSNFQKFNTAFLALRRLRSAQLFVLLDTDRTAYKIVSLQHHCSHLPHLSFLHTKVLSATMLAAEDPVELDGDVKHEETPNAVDDAGATPSPANIEESNDAPNDADVAVITPEKPGLVLLQEASDTDSSRSVSPMSHEGANESKENESSTKVADQVKHIFSNGPPPSPTRMELSVSTTATTPLAEGISKEVGTNLLLEGQDMVSGGEPNAHEEVITNKVEETVPLSEEMHTSGNGGKVQWSSESMEKELAEAKAENAQLRADLEKERSGKKFSADDPFAPREGKTLVWTGVTMTLVRT
jgi:hypothetical protein